MPQQNSLKSIRKPFYVMVILHMTKLKESHSKLLGARAQDVVDMHYNRALRFRC
jgi:hypothetical protein